MAGKKVKGEVEGIRSELQNLSEAVWALREHINVQNAGAAAATSSRRPKLVHANGEQASNLAGSGEGRGAVSTSGVVRDALGTREYRWEFQASADDLLAIDDDHASRVLAAIGHRQRLAILKAILNKPTTAAELVTSLDLGTTGAAYHHLNVLQSADLVTQESRGVFLVSPQRVSAIFAILAGLSSVEFTTFTELPDTDSGSDTGTDGDGKGKKRKGA